MPPVSSVGLPTMPIATPAASGPRAVSRFERRCDRPGHRPRSDRGAGGMACATPSKGRAGASHAPLRDLARIDRRSVDGAVAGRQTARVHRESERAADVVDPPARRRRQPGAGWHSGREPAVLGAGRTQHRVLRRREVEADRHCGRNAAGGRGRAERPRRHVERRRRDPLRARRGRADHACVGTRRSRRRA